ncbi:eukaryotic translation initiation factor 5B-like isoform X2 [Artemia franciscana]|uniref:Uncharacterized protein n=2 Tax=Artemia franciscana TaxID=6661 RepID=A0AA88L1R9_ARTSF|nr:hypothetical protein QYM36_010379 [Artemia franciscana]
MSEEEQLPARSILDLKSELRKKQIEAIACKQKAKVPNTGLTMKEKTQVNICKKEKSSKQLLSETEQNEEKEINASRAKLEAKAKLYDKIVEGKLGDVPSDMFLVDFENKAVEGQCVSGKLQLKGFEDLPTFGQISEAEEEELKKMHQKWAQEEIEASLKDHVTYQDVLYDEIRSHGAGYYAFSRNEAKRAAEKASLDAMRKETLEKQKEADDFKRKKEKELKERLKKVREKKRLQMGLPLEEEPEEAATLEDALPKQFEEEMPVPQELPIETETKKPSVRPWDIGKPGVSPPIEIKPTRKVLAQDEWVEERRKDRPTEFAPPVAYQQNKPQHHYNQRKGTHSAHLFFTQQQKRTTASTTVENNNKYQQQQQQKVVLAQQQKPKPENAFEENLPISEKPNDVVHICGSGKRITTADIFNTELDSNIEQNDVTTETINGTSVCMDSKKLYKENSNFASNNVEEKKNSYESTTGLLKEDLNADKTLEDAESVESEMIDGDLATMESTRHSKGMSNFSRDYVNEETKNHSLTACSFTKDLNTKKTLKSAERVESEPINKNLVTPETNKLCKGNSIFASNYLKDKTRNYKSGSTLKLYSSDITTNFEDDISLSDRQKSAIPPPASMDYYTSSVVKRGPPIKRPKILESLSAGLSVNDKKKSDDQKKKDKGMLALF